MKKQEQEKEKTATAELRKPYYSLSDGIMAFKSAASKQGDAFLKAKAEQLSKTLEEIHEHLDKDYIWD